MGREVATPDIQMSPIGRVESALTDPASAPKQGDEGAPEASLVFEPAVVAALDGLEPGDEVIVITWLDRARRDVLRVHPRDDASRAQVGVFNTPFSGPAQSDRPASRSDHVDRGRDRQGAQPRGC